MSFTKVPKRIFNVKFKARLRTLSTVKHDVQIIYKTVVGAAVEEKDDTKHIAAITNRLELAYVDVDTHSISLFENQRHESGKTAQWLPEVGVFMITKKGHQKPYFKATNGIDDKPLVDLFPSDPDLCTQLSKFANEQ